MQCHKPAKVLRFGGIYHFHYQCRIFWGSFFLVNSENVFYYLISSEPQESTLKLYIYLHGNLKFLTNIHFIVIRTLFRRAFCSLQFDVTAVMWSPESCMSLTGANIGRGWCRKGDENVTPPHHAWFLCLTQQPLGWRVTNVRAYVLLADSVFSCCTKRVRKWCPAQNTCATTGFSARPHSRGDKETV